MGFIIGVENKDRMFAVDGIGYLVKGVSGKPTVYELTGEGQADDSGRVYFDNPRVILGRNLTPEIAKELKKALE